MTSCSQPLDIVVLMDYWLGIPAAGSEHGDEEAVIEEHLLSCDACGAVLREGIALAGGIRALAREGSLRVVVSDGFLQRAAESGLRVREYAPPAGGSVQCTVTAEDDLLIGRLTAEALRGAAPPDGRIDLCLCDEHGVEQLRLPDIPVHPDADTVIYQESVSFAKAAPSHRMIVRLLTCDNAGGERLIGEFTFNHFRSLPGPGSL